MNRICQQSQITSHILDDRVQTARKSQGWHGHFSEKPQRHTGALSKARPQVFTLPAPHSSGQIFDAVARQNPLDANHLGTHLPKQKPLNSKAQAVLTLATLLSSWRLPGADAASNMKGYRKPRPTQPQSHAMKVRDHGGAAAREGSNFSSIRLTRSLQFDSWELAPNIGSTDSEFPRGKVKIHSAPKAHPQTSSSAALGKAKWLDLTRARPRIETPTAALIAVMRHAGSHTKQVEKVIAELDHAMDMAPSRLAKLVGSKKLVNKAARLYSASRQVGSDTPLKQRSRGETAQRRLEFVSALKDERLQQRLFLPDNLSASERASSVYFDGNAIVNALGKTILELADDPALMRLPAFANLTQSARREMVTRWMDAHGQDTRYPIGTIAHSMASVLKTAAMARGKAPAAAYASQEALDQAFSNLVQQWPSQESTLIDPRVLFGLHLAKTQGIKLSGTAAERLASLSGVIKDLLTEADGPPRFDRRAVALEILQEKTKLPKGELDFEPRFGGETLLDYFIDTAEKFFPTPGNVPHVPVPYLNGGYGSVGLEEINKYRAAKAQFNAALPQHPWFAASARLALRRENANLTPDVLTARINEIASQYKQGNSNSLSELKHWLDNMPIISSVMGVAEGIVHGSPEEIISAVPILGNIYNAVDGVAAGDGERAATALITMVPFLGAGYVIVHGLADGDAAEVVGGALGLGLDFVTFGEGHLAINSRVVGHAEIAGGLVAPHMFSHQELPSPLRLQAQHSLRALADLGVEDRALALTDKTGKHGSVGDPYGIAGGGLDASHLLSSEIAKVADRMVPVPPEKIPKLMRRRQDGTWQNPSTLAHYAQIGPHLYRLALDAAASVPERPVWNPVDPTGNGRDRRIRLQQVDGQWQTARDAPGLRGGAPKEVLRIISESAAEALDVAVPEAYARRHWHERAPSLPASLQAEQSTRPVIVSRTETVRVVEQILRGYQDLRHEPGIVEQTFNQHISVSRMHPDGKLVLSSEDAAGIAAFLRKLYDTSETFRSLYNGAVDSGRIGEDAKWQIHVCGDQACRPECDFQARILTVPDIEVNELSFIADKQLLSSNGKLFAPNGRRVILHEAIHMLTGKLDPSLSDWFDQENLSEAIQQFGLGERGGVVYLEDRILKEAGIEAKTRLTYPGISEEKKNALEIAGVDYDSLEKYVKLQDDYLNALFPRTGLFTTVSACCNIQK